MSPRDRRNPFKRSPKSPFDESGPNADALRRSLEWLERHDRDVPSPDPSVELRKKANRTSVESEGPRQPEEAAVEGEPSQTETEPQAKPSGEESSQSDPANTAETEPEAAETEIAHTEGVETQPHEIEPIEAEAAQEDTQPAADKPSSEVDETEVTVTQLANIEADRVEDAEIRNAIQPSYIRTLDRRRFPRRDASETVDIPKHERRCCICQHPDRELIEEGFLQWRRTADLRREFDLPNRDCVYRHAHAFGLFQRRARYMRLGLENIIEESSHCVVTAESVIRAIRAHSCLDDSGRWIEPPRRVIICRETAPKKKRKHAALPRRTQRIPPRPPMEDSYPEQLPDASG